MAGRRARIFHLIKGLGRGGAETLLSEGARFADRDRFELAYGYFLPWKDALVASLEGQGADVTCFDRRGRVSIVTATRLVAARLRVWDASLVHAHLPLAGVVARRAARAVGIPCVYTEHNTLERYHRLTRFLSTRTYPLQTEAIAVSDEVAASIRRHVRAPIPVTVVPNGIDTERFAPWTVDPGAARALLGLAPEVPVVGTVAVLGVQKALEHWLGAAAAVRRARPDTRFVLVGDGPLRAELETLAASLGLEEAIIWPGLVEDVRPYIAAMDVFMMSSRFEGLPLALLEAMAMEKAVVATHVGGIPQVLDHGSNGLLVASGNPALLAAAAEQLLDSQDDREALGRAARQTVVDAFSIPVMTRRVEEVYSRILGLNGK